jgi:hypothetical protein
MVNSVQYKQYFEFCDFFVFFSRLDDYLILLPLGNISVDGQKMKII